MSTTIDELRRQFSTPGVVRQILLRPQKHFEPVTVESVSATVDMGLDGDHYSGSSGKRQVTLIQQEHLAVIASLMNNSAVNAALLRRNIVVSGINLLALKDCEFMLGTAMLKMTALCHPCSRMEKVLGTGGYNAMRGHGGITAKVVKNGIIHTGDTLTVVSFSETMGSDKIDREI